jgi:hypothetical protein
MAIIMGTFHTHPALQNHAGNSQWSHTIQPAGKRMMEKDANKALGSFLNAPTMISIPNIKHPYPDSTDEGAVTSAARDCLNNIHEGPKFVMLSSSASQLPGHVVGETPAQQIPASQARPGGVQQAASGLASGGHGPQTVSSAVPSGSPSNAHLEWSARVRCNKYELGGSFSVLFFLVNVPDDPDEWFMSPHFAGSFEAFVASDTRSQSDHNIQGFVNLDDGLLKHSGQDTLEPNVVVPFLTNNLHWRIQKVNGTVVELPSLEVVVLATPVSLPPGARFPVRGEPQLYPNITHGRPGGSRNA